MNLSWTDVTNGILIDKLKELSADIPNLQVTVSVNMPETYPNVNQYNNLLKNVKAYSRKYIHGTYIIYCLSI